jgi:transposase
MQGQKHFSEKLFTSFQLSERVPPDNFYRRLKELLDLDWLYKSTKSYYGTEGQESIDPTVFFKLMLVGYLENLGSDRRIMSTVSLRLDLLYFIGYDIDEPLPWHSTLSRTRQLFGEDVFKEFFRQVLKQCIAKGMVSGRRQAMDSAPVKANASMDSLVEKEILEDADGYADELTEENDDDDNGNTNDSVRATKKKSVDQQHEWKGRAYKGRPGANDERSKFVSNHTHYSSTDKDARVSVKPGKPRQLNYLAQISVDTAHHVITQIQSDYADKRDSQCLPSLLENTISNLKEEGLAIEEVLADAGYSSGEALQALEDNNITGYIPNFGQYKSSREGFTYNKQRDEYTCIRGAKLLYKKTHVNGRGYWMKQYRSSRKDCMQCPLRTSCISAVGKEKKIEDTVDKHLYDRMHARLQTARAKQMKKLRQSTVEPVLGTLINYLSMRRVNTRGIRQAGKCMLMAAVAYNLKKLLKWQHRRIETVTNALIKELPASILMLLARIMFPKLKPRLQPAHLH